MNISQVAFGLVIVTLLLLCTYSAAQDEQQQQELKPPRPRSLISRANFNFNHFKSLFNKSYASIVEELARRKIFLGRVVQAFVSQVKYMYRRATSFLGVNQLSDKTSKELKSTRMKYGQLCLSKEFKALEDEDTDIFVDSLDKFGADAVADVADIKRELKEVEEHKHEPGYQEVAEEFEKANVSKEIEHEEMEEVKLERKLKNHFYHEEPSSSFTHPNPSVVDSAYYMPGTGFADSAINGLAESLKDTSLPETKLPDKVFTDLRESGCLTPVKSQGNCGSCYAFASIALYEFIYCHSTGKLRDFSQQYMIDCGSRSGLEGCEGGAMSETAKFVDEYGLELASEYPYLEREDYCPYLENSTAQSMGYIKPTFTGHVVIRLDALDDYLDKKRFRRTEGRKPILFGLLAPKDFESYGGGVDVSRDCSEEDGHAMLIVGHGREDGIEYYLLRNSLGESWGLDGYYKISKESLRECSADERGLISLAYFDEQPNPSYVPPSKKDPNRNPPPPRERNSILDRIALYL